MQIFDGKTLDGWNGNPEIWHVAAGAIIGESSPEKPSGTTNIFYTKEQPGNFMLKLEVSWKAPAPMAGSSTAARTLLRRRGRFCHVFRMLSDSRSRK